MISETEMLNVNPIQITVGSIHQARSSWLVDKRRMATNYILNKIVDALPVDDWKKLQAYLEQENPCVEVLNG